MEIEYCLINLLLYRIVYEWKELVNNKEIHIYSLYVVVLEE